LLHTYSDQSVGQPGLFGNSIAPTIAVTRNLTDNEPNLLFSSAGRHQIYAPPNAFGNWQVVHSHIGPTTRQINVTPIGDTVITGQVRYFNNNNNQVVESFYQTTSVATGNSIANIEVRLKGTPTGSSCWVDVL